MRKSKSADVLAAPDIQRHTERILALREEERQARGKSGRIIAAIGAELIAVKEALDKTPDKTAWLRWLKDHVHDSADTAERYMGVARFAEKFRNVAEFFELDPSVLYRMPLFRATSFYALCQGSSCAKLLPSARGVVWHRHKA